MIGYIDNLKKKPEHVKKRFAFIVAFSFSFLILAGWIASYGFTSSAVVATDIDGDTTKVETPVSSLTASVSGAWDDIKSIFTSSNKADYSAPNIEATAGKR